MLSLLWLARAAAAPTAAQLLAELEQDAPHRPAIEGSLERAKKALGRAHSMDQAGDVRHAALMRAVAREWLACARDLVRTSEAEANAEKAEKTVDDLETKRVRSQALLEETIARRERAQALLEQLEHEPKQPPPADKTDARGKKDKPNVKKPPPVNE